ncbi:MAG: hypothetical protein M1330_04240 [Armatimonadetes bacterium]|nr:hypothetical protein [Armatimonadota bacterium]
MKGISPKQWVIGAIAVVAIIIAAMLIFKTATKNTPHRVYSIHVAPFGKSAWVRAQKAKGALAPSATPSAEPGAAAAGPTAAAGH